MATVTIGSTTYTVYSDVSTADDYFNGSVSFSTWNGFTTDQKARGLVSATRLIDRQGWQGSKDDEAQVLDFPRTGLVNCAGNDVTSAESLTLAIEASQLLALDLLNGEELETSTSTEDRTKRLKAGSVEIEYFRADKDQDTRFPTDVMELLGCFLSGSSPISGSIASGVDGEALDTDFSFTNGF